jgi:hypothetical protein
MKWKSTIMFLAVLTLNCQNTAQNDQASGGDTPPVTDDLPQPADETVEMSLNGVRHTLVNKLDCKNGGIGIVFFKSATPGDLLPTLFLHATDLAATGNIMINSASNPPAWHMDVDAADGSWVTEATGCAATVVENSATIFELKTVSCGIRRPGATGRVSFRVRCTKGT